LGFWLRERVRANESGRGKRGGDGGWEEVEHVAVKAKGEAFDVVVIGFAAIDDDVGSAAVDSHEGEAGSGMNGERGAEGNDEVRASGGFGGAAEIAGVERLAEADGGRLEEAAAFAEGRLSMLAEEGEVRRGVAALEAALAFYFEV
jgi:hypothetical protein